jgi:hypothetical protein
MSTKVVQQKNEDECEDNELWKLEFDYKQHVDLGTPCLEVRMSMITDDF